MERVLKTIGIMHGIVGTISALCLCVLLLRESVCWFLLIFGIFESTVISISAILIGLGESLEQGNQIRNQVVSQRIFVNDALASKGIVIASNSKLDLLAISEKENNPKETWTCRKCGSINVCNTQYCKDCGEFK